MQIIPTKNISNISISYIHKLSIGSQIIYISTLLAVAITFISLPFVYTTVSVKGQGLLQSSIEKMELSAPSSGRLISMNLADNKKINKGDILLILDATLPKQQNVLLSKTTTELQEKINDIEQAIAALQKPPHNNPQLSTGLYQSAWQQYVVQLQQAKIETEQAHRIFQRHEILHQKQVITQAEYEQYKFNYEQAFNNQEILVKKYKNQWQAEATQYRKEWRDLQNQEIQIKEQEKQYILKATINGSVQNLTGLQAGAYVYANQKIGEISPDSALLAYCYIKPSDIGLIKKQQSVIFQVDAFNYNQWGMLTGKVIDISDDIVIQNQTPYFKVKCQLDRDYLQLKNGYKGQVKKGMTFNANFTVARRSLYQLLYDKADDWLNPEKVSANL